MTKSARPRLRWYQYSLRSLLLFVVVCAIPCSWVAVRRERAWRQRQAVKAIETPRASGLNGSVWYDYEIGPSGFPVPGAEPPYPRWMRRALGDDFFADVVEADAPCNFGCEHLENLPRLRRLVLRGKEFGDEDLQHLAGLKELRSLKLSRSSVGDAGLQRLEKLTQLQELNLSATINVTDAGLKSLGRLGRLRSLNLGCTGITDAGLRHIRTLRELERLDLAFTHVGDAGLENLEGLANLQDLALECTRVTDAGLEHLKGLSQLRALDLAAGPTVGPKITDAGLRRIKGLVSLETLFLAGNRGITDAGLKYLKRMKNLRYLDVEDTSVTSAGAKDLQGQGQLQVVHDPF